MAAYARVVALLGWSLAACGAGPDPGPAFEMPAGEVMLVAESCEKWERCSGSFYAVYDSVSDCIDRSVETHEQFFRDRGSTCYELSLSYEQCTLDEYACSYYPTPIGGGPCLSEFEAAFSECRP